MPLSQTLPLPTLAQLARMLMHKRVQTGTHTAAAFPFRKELDLALPPQVLLYSNCKWLLQHAQLARPLKLRQGVGWGVLAFLTELIGSEEAKFAIQRARVVLSCSLDKGSGRKAAFPTPSPSTIQCQVEA